MLSKNNNLTNAQEKVFRYLEKYIKLEGFPPSYSEIAKAFRFSSDGTVRTYLEHLEKKGYIKRTKKARGIQLLKELEVNSIPIIGKIAAGNPSLAIENYIDKIDNIKQLQFKEGRFALTVSGDSMINAGIFNKDIAIIQTNKEPKNNDIVAALIENEATLKRLIIKENKLTLKPENDNYQPIHITKNKISSTILGVFIALIRTV